MGFVKAVLDAIVDRKENNLARNAPRYDVLKVCLFVQKYVWVLNRVKETF